MFSETPDVPHRAFCIAGPSQRIETLGIDFEGKFGVVVDKVPMGATPAQALAAVRIVVQLNSPVAVTPDELGAAWRDGRVHLDLEVEWNGAAFGHPNGREMNFGFGELVAHVFVSRPRLSVSLYPPCFTGCSAATGATDAPSMP